MKVSSLIMSFLLLSFYGLETQNINFKLTGFCTDTTIKEIKVFEQDFFIDYQGPVVLAKTTRGIDGKFRLTIPVRKARFVSFSTGDTSWNLFISPNQIETFVVQGTKKKNVNFENGLAYLSNCANQLEDYEKQSSVREPKYKDNDDLNEYLSKVDDFIRSKKTFVRNFSLNHNVNADFIMTLLNYERIGLLYRPLPLRAGNLLATNKQYINALQSIPFNREDLLEDVTYKSALRNKYIFSKSEIRSIQTNYREIYTSIMANTKGRTRESLLSCLVSMYVNNDQPNVNHNWFMKTLEDALKTVKDTTYLSKLKFNYEKFVVIGKEFPDNVLDSTSFVSYGNSEKITLRKLLEEHKNKSIYVDFWASWCIPCRIDIEESGKSKAYLKSKEIEVVYISIDCDDKLWKKVVKEDSIEHNQYLLEKGVKSPMGKFLDVISIPRYILLDKKHQIANINAPRLNERAFTSLEQYLNSSKGPKTKVVTYD